MDEQQQRFVGTAIEVLARAARETCGATPVESAGEAAGRAAAGERVVRLLPADPPDPGEASAFVEVRDWNPARAHSMPLRAVSLFAADVPAAAALLPLAFDVCARTGRPVICRLAGDAPGRLHAIEVGNPSPHGSPIVLRAADRPLDADVARILDEACLARFGMPPSFVDPSDAPGRSTGSEAGSLAAANGAPEEGGPGWTLAAAPGSDAARLWLRGLLAAIPGPVPRAEEIRAVPGAAALRLGGTHSAGRPAGDVPPVDLLYVHGGPQAAPAAALDAVIAGGAIVVGVAGGEEGEGDDRPSGSTVAAWARAAERGVALRALDLSAVAPERTPGQGPEPVAGGGSALLRAVLAAARAPHAAGAEDLSTELAPPASPAPHVERPPLREPRAGESSASPSALRRFHAGLEARTAAADAFAAAPLGLAALPQPEAASAGTGTAALLRLYREALGDGRAQRVQALSERLDATVEALDALLRAGRGSDGSIAAELGAAGSAFFDIDRLGGVAGQGRRRAGLDPARRARIAAAREALAEWRQALDPTERAVVFHRPDRAPGIDVDGFATRPARDPVAAASGYFEGLAARHARFVRALRVARLELDGAYDPELHDRPLATLDWEAFSREELTLLPAIAALESADALRGEVLGTLSQTLLSGRPVHALVVEEIGEGILASALTRHHPGLGYLAVAHREAVVVETTLARPEHALDGLRALVGASRPGVALVATAPEGAAEAPTLLEAALRSRLTPCLHYDPTAGEAGAPRFDVDGNPAPDADWPAIDVRIAGADGIERTVREEFTPAHVAALLPAVSGHLRPIGPEGWAADQTPIADYVAAIRGRMPEGLPYVSLASADGTLGRAIATRELAFACFDRWRYWKMLRALAAAGTARAPEAAAGAVEPTTSTAGAGSDTAAEAAGRRALETGIARLVAALVGGMPVAPAPGSPQTAESTTLAAAEESGPAPVAGRPAPPISAGAHIDSMLCTSCNECIQLNGKLFVYDANKQATIGDPRAGTFAELVKAAERCPARCIHPGAPRPDDRSATAKVVARAARFA